MSHSIQNRIIDLIKELKIELLLSLNGGKDISEEEYMALPIDKQKAIFKEKIELAYTLVVFGDFIKSHAKNLELYEKFVDSMQDWVIRFNLASDKVEKKDNE